MAHRADDIRHDIEDTRAAMTEKLAMLEERVRETVAGTQASVEEIVEHVQGTVGGYPSPRRSAPLISPHRWSNTRGRCLVGRCWWVICSEAGVMAARLLLAPHGTYSPLVRSRSRG